MATTAIRNAILQKDKKRDSLIFLPPLAVVDVIDKESVP